MEAIKSFLGSRRMQVAKVLLVLSAVAILFGGFKLLTYSLPMAMGSYEDAANSAGADKATALYDAGVIAYERGDYETAQKLLVQAYSACTDSEGHLSKSRTALAGDIQFALGNSLAKQKKVGDAIQAYEQALRHNPDHMMAKYDLELLQQSSSGGGGKAPGNGSGGGNKKGI